MSSTYGYACKIWYDLVISTFLEAFGVSCSEGLRDSSHTNCWQTILKKYSECCTIGNHQGVGANTIPDWPKASKNLTAKKCIAIKVRGAGNKLKSSFSLSHIATWCKLNLRGNLPPQKITKQERIFPISFLFFPNTCNQKATRCYCTNHWYAQHSNKSLPSFLASLPSIRCILHNHSSN